MLETATKIISKSNTKISANHLFMVLLITQPCVGAELCFDMPLLGFFVDPRLHEIQNKH